MKNTLIVGAILLVAGLGIGYIIGASNTQTAPIAQDTVMHQMPDGTTMGNDSMNMSDMMGDMNAALRGKTGNELDRAFIDMMIVHHEGAVEMAEILLQGTQRPELIQLAGDIITAQTAEIEMMEQWRTAWFGI